MTNTPPHAGHQAHHSILSHFTRNRQLIPSEIHYSIVRIRGNLIFIARAYYTIDYTFF